MKRNTWITILSVVSLLTIALGAGSTQAAQATDSGFTIADFRLNSAQELADVCTVQSGEEHYHMATAFCFGFFEDCLSFSQIYFFLFKNQLRLLTTGQIYNPGYVEATHLFLKAQLLL